MTLPASGKVLNCDKQLSYIETKEAFAVQDLLLIPSEYRINYEQDVVNVICAMGYKVTVYMYDYLYSRKEYFIVTDEAGQVIVKCSGR